MGYIPFEFQNLAANKMSTVLGLFATVVPGAPSGGVQPLYRSTLAHDRNWFP